MQLEKAIVDKDPSQLDPRNPEDFAELVDLHHRELLVYARTLTREVNTARDIVQESFIVAFQKIHTFDVTRDFATWMRGIVRNKWREWLRKNRRYELTDDDLSEIDADIAAWQGERAAGSSTVFDALEACLERLPQSLRDAVQAFYYDSLSGEEVSESLGVAPAAVRKRLQRARTLLKECVDRKLEQEPRE
ncbi:MAG: sigma-70 family RNA polymerase sigma factor [Verrucomicrobiales bacterium]|nr:sigma-70 family RNA polymerase sigma factor [Verrucomicrobiales bacterium]